MSEKIFKAACVVIVVVQCFAIFSLKSQINELESHIGITEKNQEMIVDAVKNMTEVMKMIVEVK